MDKIVHSFTPPPHCHLISNTVISFRDCCHGLLNTIPTSALVLHHYHKARSLLHSTRSFQSPQSLPIQNPNKASLLSLNKIKVLYPALKRLCDLASTFLILQDFLFLTLVQPSRTLCCSLGMVNSISASRLFHLQATASNLDLPFHFPDYTIKNSTSSSSLSYHLSCSI